MKTSIKSLLQTMLISALWAYVLSATPIAKANDQVSITYSYIIGDFNNWELPSEESLNGAIPMENNYSEPGFGAQLEWTDVSISSLGTRFCLYSPLGIDAAGKLKFIGMCDDVSNHSFDYWDDTNTIHKVGSSCRVDYHKKLSDVEPFKIISDPQSDKDTSGRITLFYSYAVDTDNFQLDLEPEAKRNPAEVSELELITEDPEYYDLSGRKISNPKPGIYLLKTNAQFVKVLIK